MLHLYSEIPSSVQFEGAEYNLALSFDNVLLAYAALQDEEMTFSDRLETYLSLIVADKLPAEEKWIEFYDSLQGVLSLEQSSAVKYDINGDPMPTARDDSEPDFDFDIDARYIYAAFMQAYGIDLYKEQGKLHWLKFVMLLNALPEDTMFRQIRQIRVTDTSKIKDKQYKEQIKSQQRAFALPNTKLRKEDDDYGS